jgi:tripartite motif-containing protein 45
LQFLPEVKAPSNKAQNNIPLYGIITTQIVSAKHCTLETTEGLMNLRVHRKAELVLLSKDKEDRQMCHGGLVLSVDLKCKDGVARTIPTQVSDKRDGTYLITFVPDISGLLKLQITINEKPIKVCHIERKGRSS